MLSSRNLFSVTAKPNAEHMLAVDETHTLYIREYGNPAGIPLTVCHGGPGAGCEAKQASYFDPEKYRIILFDQRGSGKSLPKGSLKNNTPAFLLTDMEKIRAYFRVDKWVLFGGSWGSTLALLYAEAYPERVLGLILRGVFLARDKDCRSFYDDASPAALCNPQAWREFKNSIQKLSGRNTMPADLLVTVHALLIYPETQMQAVRALHQWEGVIAYFNPPADMSAADDVNVNVYLIEVDYTINRCYLEENQILKNIDKIPQVPVYIIHGKGDFVCPQYQAFDLQEALATCGVEVRYQECLAGHAGSEKTVVAAVLNATESMAEAVMFSHVGNMNSLRS